MTARLGPREVVPHSRAEAWGGLAYGVRLSPAIGIRGLMNDSTTQDAAGQQTFVARGDRANEVSLATQGKRP